MFWVLFLGAGWATQPTDPFEEAVSVEEAAPHETGSDERPLVPPGAVPSHLQEVAREVRGRPLPERIEVLSEEMLGQGYVVNPIGEGVGRDPDPFVRYDVQDCLTFVEEVLALSLAGDPAHAAPVRLGLRYGSNPRTYAGRRHFMELQWIPGAVADGWMVEKTAEYGATLKMSRTVHRETWEQWPGLIGFGLDIEDLPTGEMVLDVLPLSAAQEVHSEFRPGSILMVVREDQPWRGPLWVTHVGIVVSSPAGLRLRHATKMSGRVRDHSLAWYLEHIGTYEHRPTAGVLLFEALEQTPRRLGP